MLLFPLLTVLWVQHSHARTHSLRCFPLAVSHPGPGVPEFISVGYVDSHAITTYDSVTRQKEPRAPWMAKNLAPDHWESWQQTFKEELKGLQKHYNHSGLHTYQRMIGCELLEDGSTTGFLQYAYDGQDFIVFNKDTLSWVAVDNVAQITKRTWEANLHELQYQKNWLEKMHCLAQEVLGVWKRYPRKDRTSGGKNMSKGNVSGDYNSLLQSSWLLPTRNFHDVDEKWEEIAQEVDHGGVLPSGDGTYQTWVSVDLNPQSKDVYSCHVEHGGLQMVFEASQESESVLLVANTISGTIILTIVLAGIGVLIWRRRSQEQKEADYHPTPVNECGSPS